MKILAIGNSFADDSFEYFSKIANDFNEEVIIGVLFIGGCSLKMHRYNAENNLSAYEYRKDMGCGFINHKDYSIKKALEDEDATYIDKCNEDTIGEEEVNKEYYEALEDKEAAYNKINMYKLMDDEYIDSATSDNSKYKNKSCNRLETKENYNVPIIRRMYSDLDDEYARGFKR